MCREPVKNPVEENSVVEVYFQCEAESPLDRALLDAIEQVGGVSVTALKIPCQQVLYALVCMHDMVSEAHCQGIIVNSCRLCTSHAMMCCGQRSSLVTLCTVGCD